MGLRYDSTVIYPGLSLFRILPLDATMQKNADGSLSELHTRTNASGIDLVSDPRIGQAWDDIRDSDKDTRWSLAVYADGGGDGGSSTKLTLNALGLWRPL